MLTIDNGILALQRSGAKITTQRVAIIRDLTGRTDHPSAEDIFRDLKSSFPTLSIATVYSTTRLLAGASAIRMLTIDDKHVCYDPDTSPHAHFLCTKCKKLIDVPISADLLHEASHVDGVDSVSSSEIFHYGVCCTCAAAAANC